MDLLSGVQWVLVVSNIDLTTKVPRVSPSAFLESSIKDFIININNDYRYLKMGYYVSVHAETLGNPVIPTSGNMIDANRIPVFLLRSSKAGIPTMPCIVTSSVKQIISEVGFPVVVFAVNPFIYDGFKIAKNRSSLYRAVKSLSMNYKFAVCAIPLKGEILSFKSIFGKCELEGDAKGVSERVYEVFKIPICKLHVQLVDGKAYLCGLQPVNREELTPSDLKLISEEIFLMSRHGDPVIV
ncbi:MAG: RimK-like ATPgrasp N-terminal domain-containing protein [Candidatus Bathyarchaeales archaeon]